MSVSGRADADSQQTAGLRLRDVVLGLGFTCTSGAAIVAHTFLGLPMAFTVPFVVLPTSAMVVGAILFHRKLYGRLRSFSTLLIVGGVLGLAATLVYDAVRPVLIWAMQVPYEPFRAIRIFGMLMTGRPEFDSVTLAAGWTYHFWNGISFGMMFALMRPRGGALAGLAWGMGLQLMMMAMYPTLLKIRLDNPGFLASGIVGHSLWGLVLGESVRRWGPLASRPALSQGGR